MKTWQRGVLMLTLLATLVADSGCEECGEFESVESGDYVVAGHSLGILTWLAGAGMKVDREAKLATLRYTREGTTYEVRFKLAP